ncbi:MAG TPA: type I methionyl aminopeptidase [Tepidisphaeraceae bacterium]|jgi:methionyl aminopeptidase
MPIIIKTRRELDAMRRAGQVAHQIMYAMKRAAVPGVTTSSLDQLARDLMIRHGAVSLSRNYPTYKDGEGFPGFTCISVNEVVVHGIPGGRLLREGDVVTLDVALRYEGYCSDTAITVPIGPINPQRQKLLDITRRTLDVAIEHMKPGRKWTDIARLMQHFVESNGFSVVREFVGHGIGRQMHEDPKVPNFVTVDQLRGDFKLRPGMTLAVEPMVVAGRRDVQMLDDGWTVVTEDSQPAAHFEHTVAVTEVGVEILTDGNPPAAPGAVPVPAAAKA